MRSVLRRRLGPVANRRATGESGFKSNSFGAISSSLVCMVVCRTVALYATVAVLGTMFFFLLHYLGNRIPYELAQQRFVEAFEENWPYESYVYVSGLNRQYEYCMMSRMVMAGSKRDTGNHWLMDVVLPQDITEPVEGGCPTLKAVSLGARIDDTHPANRRYWWGSKALYALALRHLSVSDFHRLILAATYCAYVMLAGALLLVGRRALMLAAPVIVFGIFFSGIHYLASVSNGIPYLWAVLAAAILAGLLSKQVSPQVVRMYCFIAGMVSSFLWFFDGHNFLAVALIGLISWLGHEHLTAYHGIRRAVGHIAIYAAGFVACFALNQIIKILILIHGSMALEGSDYINNVVTQGLFTEVTSHFGRIISPQPWDLSARDMDVYWALAPMKTLGQIQTIVSVLALVAAASCAALEVWKGRPQLAGSILWLVGLMLAVSVHFILGNDIPIRGARFMFVPLALCCTCFILAIMEADRSIVFSLIGAVVFGLLSILGYWRANVAAIADVIESTRPVIRADFSVYHSDDRLIYVKEECGDDDVTTKFWLHVFPVDEATPAAKPLRVHVYIDFSFKVKQLPLNDLEDRCIAVFDLPDHKISAIRTGQYELPGRRQSWDGKFEIGEAAQ